MTSQRPDSVSPWSSVDLVAFWETLKLRWWVVPVVVGLAVGFLWAQESDLRTEPSSYSMVRSYEARDPTAVLASVGIDPVSVRSFPDVNNQVLILQSAATREEIAQQSGVSATVTVTKGRPTFSLIDTLESDGQSSFVFQSAGVPTYSFSCTEPVKSDCSTAIEAYVVKATELRQQSLLAGLNDLKSVLTEVQTLSNDPSVATKLAALDVLLDRSDTPLALIGEYEEAIGATISSVRRPTYTFGVGAGLLVSLLILLQLTYSDSRVRSARQLTRLIGDELLLGEVANVARDVADRRTAISMRNVLNRNGVSSLRFVPLRGSLGDSSAVLRIAAISDVAASVSVPFGELGVSELTKPSTTEADVLVVQRHRDSRRDVLEATSGLERSGRVFAGVVLVDDAAQR